MYVYLFSAITAPLCIIFDDLHSNFRQCRSHFDIIPPNRPAYLHTLILCTEGCIMVVHMLTLDLGLCQAIPFNCPWDEHGDFYKRMLLGRGLCAESEVKCRIEDNHYAIPCIDYIVSCWIQKGCQSLQFDTITETYGEVSCEKTFHCICQGKLLQFDLFYKVLGTVSWTNGR